MHTHFHVQVEYPDGQIKEFNASVGGGTMQPEDLIAFYKKQNKFPGAKEIRATATGGDVRKLADILKSAAPDVDFATASFSPTPMPEIIKTE